MIAFNLFPGGRQKALTMSYDDGVIQDRRLVEIFNKNGIKGTFHLNGGSLGTNDKYNLTRDEIATLFQNHEVSAHSYSHPSLISIPESELRNQIIDDRKMLERLTKKIVRGMSYPFGDYNDDIIKIISGLGIKYARTVHSTHDFSLPADFMRWHPTCHHNDNILKRWEQFLNYNSWGKFAVYYIWGHSYEFDNDNNWHMIEEFCQTAGHNDEVWYATNLEIYEYVTAVQDLIFSADLKSVFNPSLLELWISVDGRAVVIESGEMRGL